MHLVFYFFFKQDDKVTVHFSGNPGYVVGLPLVSGMRAAKYPLNRLRLFLPFKAPVWNIWRETVTLDCSALYCAVNRHFDSFMASI